MAIADSSHHHHKWGLCSFWQSATQSFSSSSSTQNLNNQSQNHGQQNGGVASSTRSSAVSSVVRSILPARRRLRLDPSNNLYFPYEPGKQARSAVRINNSSKSLVAFKFQTTAPKSCYMRPPGGILAPGEGLIATVFKFVEHPENSEKAINQSKVKFKIMSLKVKEGTDYVPELFDEYRDQVTVERILRVVFLDPERANPSIYNELYGHAMARNKLKKKPINTWKQENARRGKKTYSRYDMKQRIKTERKEGDVTRVARTESSVEEKWKAEHAEQVKQARDGQPTYTLITIGK